MPLSELHDPSKGYIVDDTWVISIEVTCWMMKRGLNRWSERERRSTNCHRGQALQNQNQIRFKNEIID